jgi:RNA-directed DNA polymerase
MKPDPWPTFSDVMAAYRKCRYKKRPSIHQIRFESRLGENLLSLHSDLKSRKYQPSRSKCFVVTIPKPREIFAAHFRDRIVHHLLVSRLEPYWERRFVHSSFACRKDRGGYKAMAYVDQQARRVSQGGQRKVFVLQVDIASFFVTIRRPILTELLLKGVRDEYFRWLIETSFRHDARENVWVESAPEVRALIPPHKSWFYQDKDGGIPIGNLTSQFGANVYLNGIDHWVLRSLRPGAYLRYMDDLTLLDTDSDRLSRMIEPINSWLQKNRGQSLNPSKTTLKPLSSGIQYLGYKIRQDLAQGGGTFLKSPESKKWEFIRAIKKFESSPVEKTLPCHPLEFTNRSIARHKMLSCINARLGFLKHAETYRLRRDAIERLKMQLSNPERLPSLIFDPWCPVRSEQNYLSIRLR